MAFGQLQDEVPGMSDEASAGLEQSLLQARQRPALDGDRQDQPTQEIAEVVGDMCPPSLCGRRAATKRWTGWTAGGGPHNRQREFSHASKDSSVRQTGFAGSAAEAAVGGSHTRRAASLARVVISA